MNSKVLLGVPIGSNPMWYPTTCASRKTQLSRGPRKQSTQNSKTPTRKMESKRRKKEANHPEIQVIVTVNAIYFWVILSERHMNKVIFDLMKS
jgi:hypothetical protein